MNRKLHVFLLLLVVAAPAVFAADPTAPGPFAVTREEYNFGDTAFNPTNFPGPVELLASVLGVRWSGIINANFAGIRPISPAGRFR